MKENTQLADVLGVETLERMMATVAAHTAELKKTEAYEALSAEEKIAKQDEVMSHVFNLFLDKKRTFVHYARAGYWADKLIGGAVTVGVGVVVAAVAMKVVGKPAEMPMEETGADAGGVQPPLFNTGFDKASDRPIRSSRELKSAV